MGKLLLVGVGGFIGSVFRYIVSGLVHEWSGWDNFPLGTFTVNIIGSLVIGLLSQLAEARGAFSPETRAFVVIGIIGGFTTFSSFANESFNLWRDGQVFLAFVNAFGQIALGLGSVWMGRMLSHMIWG